MKNQTAHILQKIIAKRPESRGEFDRARRTICAELGVQQPSNRDLFKAYQSLVEKKSINQLPQVEDFLKKANIRSLSGIAVVTSLVKPYQCPGKCVYCPTEVRMPKSYIASEPAAARSLRLDFDPYELMQGRINMLEENGHPCDKIEYIIKGGTWNAYTLTYQYWYILESFRACNNITRRAPTLRTKENDWKNVPLNILQTAVEQEQRYNERARHRIIGLTLETRPDAISPKTINHMRRQGCTRVELGLQAPDDTILALIKRGHTVDQFRAAMRLLRAAGFKVDLHFMPDLPGTTPEHDVRMYKMLFSDPGLKPDMVKIYPNTVIKSAELYEWFRDGRYTPYGDTALFETLLEMKRSTPRYCRISRLIRDIPSNEIEAGNIVTNLREMLDKKMKKREQTCQCLRCREIGRQKKNIPEGSVPTLFVDSYETDGGTEYFFSFEDPERIAVFGFLRLRLPYAADSRLLGTFVSHIHDSAFIRELHTYGQMVAIGKRNTEAAQHKGLGKRLVREAERLAAERGYKKLAVISGVGVRGYYRKLGYRKQGTYMIKNIHVDNASLT